MRHPERLTFSFVRSAAERGTMAANYMRVDSLLVRDRSAVGARVTDLERGSQFEIAARVVVVAAGPWTAELLTGTLGQQAVPTSSGRALALNVRVGRSLAKVAVGVASPSGPDRDPVCGGNRFIFAVPQGGNTLLGTWYTLPVRDDGAGSVELGVQALVKEFNQACPGLGLSTAEVMNYQWGLLPLKDGYEQGRRTALAERPRLVNHGARGGVRHLISIEGVKYTTARGVAERVVSSVFRELDRPSPVCQTAEVPLATLAQEPLIRADGSIDPAPVRRAVRQEMALRLSDIVFRRTSPGLGAAWSRAALTQIANLAAPELGWDVARQALEVDEVMRQQTGRLLVEEPVG